MNLQFNLFGFQVQVFRQPAYCYEVYYSEFDQGRFATSDYAHTEIGAIFKAWRKARSMAKYDHSQVSFVVLRYEHPEWHVHRLGEVVIKKQVKFFPKII